MKKIYLLDDAIISPLGFSTEENLTAIKNERSGLKFQKNNRLPSEGFYAGIIENELLIEAFLKIGEPKKHTKLEQMVMLAVSRILDKKFPDKPLQNSTDHFNNQRKHRFIDEIFLS